jgi:hypothetical protein
LFLIGQWKFTMFVVAVVIGLALLLAVRPIAILFVEARRAARPRKISLPFLIVLCVLIFAFIFGLTEITGDSGIDAVAYHLLGPKVWLRNGVIRPVPDNCHTAMPQTAETIYAAAMALGGDRAPGLSNVVTFAMLLLVAASLAKRVGLDCRDAWWVAALVATMSAVFTGSTHVFVDGLYASFVLMAIRVALDAESSKDFAMVGLFVGLAMGTKYTGLLSLPVVLCCPLLARAFAGEFDWQILKRASVGLAVACVIASPYYLRNWILLGSPIYPPPPLFWHFFKAKYLSAEAITQFHAYIRHRGEGLGRGIGAFLLLPFNLTYHTSNFHGAGGIGISGLALAPFGVLALRRDPIGNVLAWVALLLTVLWFVTQQESRFLIHVYIIGAIFAVMGWRYVVSVAPRYSGVLVAAVVGISVLYGIFMIGGDRVGDAKALFSARSARAREQQTIPYVESFEFLNHEPSVKRVLVLEPSVPPYYLDRDYVKPVGQWGERTLPGEPDSFEAVGRAREWDVSHVLDVKSAGTGFRVERNRPGLVLVFENSDQRIYRVRYSGGS